MDRESIYDYLSIIQLVDLTPGFRRDDFYCVLEPYTAYIKKHLNFKDMRYRGFTC